MNKGLYRLALISLIAVMLLALVAGCPRKQKKGPDPGVGMGPETSTNIIAPPVTDEENAGELQIMAYAGGERLGSAAQIYLYNPEDNKHAIATLTDGAPLKLNAGKYDVELVYVDRFNVERILWAYGLEVVAGTILKERLEFLNGTLSFNVGGAGTTYTAGDISVSVYVTGTTTRPVAQGVADTSLDILEGTYDVKFELKKGTKSDELWENGVVMKPGETTSVEVNFSGGGLTVTVQGGSALPGAVVEVFSSGSTANPSAKGVPGENLEVPPGKYDIRITVGEGKGAYEHWKKDVEVVKGKSNKVDITLPVGTLKVNAFAAGGGQIAGTEITVYAYKPSDTSSAVLYTNGAETFALDEGTFDLRVEYTNSQDKPSVWIRGVKVAGGKHQTLRADFQATSITTVVKAGNEELPGNLVQIYYYREGDDTNYVGMVIAGAPAILESGLYKIRVEYTGKPVSFDEWAGTFSAESGKAVTVEYKLKGGYVRFKNVSGELRGLSVKNVLVNVNQGDKILLPHGVYTLRTPEGEAMTIEAGGALIEY